MDTELMDLDNETNESIVPSTARSKRDGIDYHKSGSQQHEPCSQSSGTSPNETEDEYTIPSKKPASISSGIIPKRTRGSNLRRSVSTRQPEWLIETQVNEAAIDKNQNNPCVRGRGRGIRFQNRLQSLARGRGRGRGSRSELLSSHRMIVEELEENEIERGSNVIERPISQAVTPVILLSHEQIKSKIDECSAHIKNDFYSHRSKPGKSAAWDVLHEIVDEKGDLVRQFFFCTECKIVMHCSRHDGNTTQLLRHPCVKTTQKFEIQFNAADIEQLRIAAAKFVCMDLRPFSALDCRGLRDLVFSAFELGKRYPKMNSHDFFEQFPSRKLVKGTVKEEACRAESEIKVLLKMAITQGGLGCTLDLMTDKHKSNTYLAMTANIFLFGESQIESRRLVFHFGYVADIVKSRDVIKSRIIEVFDGFGISADEIKNCVTFTTDRGSNVKFEDDDTINRINCYCHMLNNVVSCMCSIETAKKVIEDTSSLVSYVRNSGLGVKCEPKLKKFVPTRWNTVFDMLTSVDSNYVKLGKILLEKEEADKTANVLTKLTDIPRSNIETMVGFLSKFKDWTKHLEAEKVPTLWMVWPTYIQLRKHLSTLETDSVIVRSMKQVGSDYVDKNEADFKPRLVHKTATVLNPLFKNIAMASDEERKHVYGEIDCKIRELELKNAVPADNAPPNLDNLDILDDFMGVPAFEARGGNQSNGGYTDELNLYLSARISPMDPFKFDLLGWWFANRHTFPNLIRIFLSIAGITASSAPSERRFSETEVILTARRANLSPGTVSDLVQARNMFLKFL